MSTEDKDDKKKSQASADAPAEEFISPVNRPSRDEKSRDAEKERGPRH